MSDRPLRILHLVAASDAGGVSRYLLDLCGAMQAQGHQVMIAGERGAWHAKFERVGLVWLEIPVKGGLLSQWKSLSALRALLNAQPVDVIHAHYRRATILGRKLQAHWPIPLLYTLHLSHMPMTWGRRWFTDFGDHVHVASLQAKRWLIDEKFASEDEISYIPHGVDPAKFPEASEQDRVSARARFGLPDDATVAAYVGRLDWPKNEGWLLDVVQKADCHLLVAGGGPHEEQFKKSSDRFGNRVHLLGELDNPLPVYQAADAVLLPSQREGFSYVNAEAMSVGTPMFRTHTSGAEELIEQDVTGKYVPIEREAFVSVAVQFLSDREKLAQMRSRCAATVREKFTLLSQIEKTIDLYRKLRNPSC